MEVWFYIMSSTPIDSTARPGGMREAIKSAARPGWGGARRVRYLDAIAEILAIDLCILLQIFSGGVLVPPYSPSRRPALSAGLSKSFARTALVAIKILVIFWHGFLFDFGQSWGVILGSFLAYLAAKLGQDRSKTRLGSVSTSKT